MRSGQKRRYSRGPLLHPFIGPHFIAVSAVSGAVLLSSSVLASPPAVGAPDPSGRGALRQAALLNPSDDDASQQKPAASRPTAPQPASTASWEAPEFLGSGKDQPRRVLHLVLSQWMTNCYVLVSRTNQAIVIDPADTLKPLPDDQWGCTGDDSEKLLKAITENHLTVRYIVHTHGHLDHVSGDPALRKAFPAAKICMNGADVDADGRPKDSHMFPDGLPKVDRLLRDGDTIILDGIRLRVLTTPGHSPGSICLLCGNWVFSGDTLFYHTVGRTNFHDGSGNWDLEMSSIRKKLYTLPDATLVLPGHALFTTIGDEKAHNPWTRDTQ